jgi:adenosylcobinamide-phosphate synthase
MWGWHPDLAVLFLAVVLDLVLGELPTRIHPTGWMGYSVVLGEKLAPHGRRGRLAVGVVLAIAIPGFWAGIAYISLHFLQASLGDIAYILAGAALLKTTFAVRMLHRVAANVRNLLVYGNFEEALANIRILVSRDSSRLTPEQATAAAVESVSENITDSMIGPWLAFALFGLPGAVAYRAINTLDSMIGYHGKYEFLGKASARLDDLINLLPARLTGLLVVAGSGVLPGQRLSNAWRIMWRDHARTESPNAGWAMSGMAGSLGVELEKVGHYRLGDPMRPVEPFDITRVIQTMYLVGALGLLIAGGLLLLKNELF